MSTRAEQRRLRLLEIEKEQHLEDAEALKMTEEQRQILLRSFQSVKFEFSDLDGLSWSDSALRKLHKESRTAKNSNNATFVVLTNADLASFSPDDTIRVSSLCRPRSSSRSNPVSGADSLQHDETALGASLKYRKRDGARIRSPIKGLFSALTSAATSGSDGWWYSSDSNKASQETKNDEVCHSNTTRTRGSTFSILSDKIFFPKSPTPTVTTTLLDFGDHVTNQKSDTFVSVTPLPSPSMPSRSRVLDMLSSSTSAPDFGPHSTRYY
ncbi:hypothetical protein AMATHDRAFT_8007 [Amanita thiersii Skay4041]|uniref:Uncharacterized protein n=1 Tax=Amanita thiersii Skay4041 TaxID=703135 RepID=A0A2A9N7V7_9AGAR|nr:hypothetical protein AMATHDRAFT_8007 [Amanita thiersii Skay4041]